MPRLKIMKLDPKAHAPERGNHGDLGYDLFALEGAQLAPGDTKPIRTGIALGFPEGWGGVVKDRSSMALKQITVSAGVIDNGYRGEILVVMTNNSSDTIQIEADQKIAQIIPVEVTDWDVEIVDHLDDTQRGAGGFGSTGSHKSNS